MIPNPWVILAVLVAFLAFGAGCYVKGRHDMEAKYIAAALEEEKAATALVVAQGKTTEAVAQAAETRAVEIRTVTKTIIQKVPVYVSQKASDQCVVPRGFVRLLNDSINGVPTLPDPAGKSDDAAASVGLDPIGRTVAGNLGTCREALSQLEAWRSWALLNAAMR